MGRGWTLRELGEGGKGIARRGVLVGRNSLRFALLHLCVWLESLRIWGKGRVILLI